MSDTWLFYWCMVLLVLYVTTHETKARRRRQMGPRVKVDAAQFLRIVEREKGLVIRGRKIPLQGTVYVTRSGDYYYFTRTREPLTFPAGVEVEDAQGILL